MIRAEEKMPRLVANPSAPPTPSPKPPPHPERKHRSQYGFGGKVNEKTGEMSYGFASNLRDVLVLNFMGVFAEFERDMIHSRLVDNHAHQLAPPDASVDYLNRLEYFLDSWESLDDSDLLPEIIRTVEFDQKRSSLSVEFDTEAISRIGFKCLQESLPDWLSAQGSGFPVLQVALPNLDAKLA